MSRPLRIEFAGALYHVTSRGDGREAIFLDNGDRDLFLGVFSAVVRDCNWAVHAYCLMDNHYHLLSKKCAKVRTLLSLAGQRFLPRSPLLANFVTDRRHFPDSLG